MTFFTLGSDPPLFSGKCNKKPKKNKAFKVQYYASVTKTDLDPPNVKNVTLFFFEGFPKIVDIMILFYMESKFIDLSDLVFKLLHYGI